MNGKEVCTGFFAVCAVVGFCDLAEVSTRYLYGKYEAAREVLSSEAMPTATPTINESEHIPAGEPFIMEGENGEVYTVKPKKNNR